MVFFAEMIFSKILQSSFVVKRFFSGSSGLGNYGLDRHSLPMSSSEVRQCFLDYFINEHGHEFYQSSPVKPATYDQSLLFVNAGMNQFKPIFLDQLDQFDHLKRLKRVVNSQKCIRVGGKHCDLETVGTDFTHHTFFEMLGNWSFNDYFKNEACSMAWNLLTKVFKIPQQRLFVTIFAGNDQLNLEPDLETFEIWRLIGVPKNRILSLGMKDNFWEMGQTGPCGICTEIHYLLNEPPSNLSLHNYKIFLLENSVEIWNLVFIQYFRDQNEQLLRLNKNFVDTGMGLERILSLVQNVPNNYATDLFTPFFERLVKLCKWPEYSHQLNNDADIAYRILADHARMASVAIADGVQPDDRGTGYLLRRVIRRAIDSLKKMEKLHPLPADVNEIDVFFILADTTIQILGKAFPELERESSLIFKTIEDEINLYSTAITRNSAVMKYSRILNLGINENHLHNQTTILDKLNEIECDLNDRILPMLSNEDDITNGQKQLENRRADLNLLHELMQVDPSLAQRFGLFNEQINIRYQQVDLMLTHMENKVHSIFEQIIQRFQLEAEDRLIRGENFTILPFENLQTIRSTGKYLNGNFFMKIALDLYGHYPFALIMKLSNESDRILVQLSVPSTFGQKLHANKWFESLDLDSSKIEQIPTKRVKKVFRFYLHGYENNFKTLTEKLYQVSKKHFDQ